MLRTVETARVHVEDMKPGTVILYGQENEPAVVRAVQSVSPAFADCACGADGEPATPSQCSCQCNGGRLHYWEVRFYGFPNPTNVYPGSEWFHAGLTQRNPPR